MLFQKDSLRIDAEATANEICRVLREQLRGPLRKQGAVLGISGGIDSSVVAALCVRALGPERVVGIMMPETDSAPESVDLAQVLADHYGFATFTEDISGALAALGCYQRRNDAVRLVFPEFDDSYKVKITNPGKILDKQTFNFFNITIEDPAGHTQSRRLPPQPYLGVVAASNLKQRLRMTMLYYHGELRNWAVIGTGNKDEHLQGFFVKHGDGGVDLQPIAHLFKTQVFQLAEYLDVPQEILSRVPTTDTYSAEVSQEEFFFGLDFYLMDMLWLAMENNVPPATAAAVLELTEEQVERAYSNIHRKIVATEHLRMSPVKVA